MGNPMKKYNELCSDLGTAEIAVELSAELWAKAQSPTVGLYKAHSKNVKNYFKAQVRMGLFRARHEKRHPLRGRAARRWAAASFEEMTDVLVELAGELHEHIGTEETMGFLIDASRASIKAQLESQKYAERRPAVEEAEQPPTKVTLPASARVRAEAGV